MRIDPTTFFSYVRRAPFGGRLTQAQVDGLNACLTAAASYSVSDPRWLAYILATAFHETGAAMAPVRENMVYSSAARIVATWPKRFVSLVEAQRYVNQPKALANKVYNGRLGNVMGTDDGWIYRGDGLVQITGRDNYKKFGVEPGMDLATSVRVLFEGMLGGMFTGKKLSDYFNATRDDPVGARAIVNGTDKASLIASYYKRFLAALTEAEKDPPPSDVSALAALPDDVPVAKETATTVVAASTAIAALTAGVGAVATAVGAIDNQWALLAFVAVLGAVLAAGAAGLRLWGSGRITIARDRA